MKKIIDLYSVLGGFSEAFVNDPNYQVIRIENNPLLKDVPHTLLGDVLEMNPKDPLFQGADLILASPPCREFSLAYGSPRGKAYREGIRGDDYKPDMKLVQEAIRWKNIIKPKYFLMENVNGSQRYFRKLRIYPIMKHGPLVFYGNFPNLLMPPGWSHLKPLQDTWSSDPLRQNKKAKLPLELSEKIKTTYEGQPTLGNWI